MGMVIGKFTGFNDTVKLAAVQYYFKVGINFELRQDLF